MIMVVVSWVIPLSVSEHLSHNFSSLKGDFIGSNLLEDLYSLKILEVDLKLWETCKPSNSSFHIVSDCGVSISGIICA